MERLKRLLQREPSREQSYEPLEGGSESPEGEHIAHPDHQSFSWIDYSVFFLLGIAMLWAWNMFLAAAPYFQRRFEKNASLLTNWQSAELSVSTVGNLGSMIVLTKLQARANYPKRIVASLIINIVVFTLLGLSTRVFLGIQPGLYFAFVITMVFIASLATGLCQNGLFAYVSGFGREEYMQAIMAGQGVAGVLPCIVQIGSVLSAPAVDTGETGENASTSAFVFFLTATAVSAISLVAFFHLLSRDSSIARMKDTAQDETTSASAPTHKSISLARLKSPFGFLAGAVFMTFGWTMVFLAFTARITSVRDPASSPRLFKPASFIPLGFLFWNVGDLVGRLIPAVPSLSLTSYPRVLYFLANFRVFLIPLYFVCNLTGRDALVKSDTFYLFIVQLISGVSNGYIGSNCMMGFVEWVDSDEREAAGSIMALSLVGGLTVGSLVSFFFANR